MGIRISFGCVCLWITIVSEASHRGGGSQILDEKLSKVG